MDAGCSLEDSCPPDKFKAFREAHPDHIALTYINCSTEVKALSRRHRHQLVSAETILSQIPREPEDHLRPRPAPRRLSQPQVRPRHAAVAGRVHRPRGVFSETELLKLKAQHPGAPVAAHPECPPHIIDHADYVGSTSGILQFAKTFAGDTLIVATEPHIIHQMELAMPDKTFIGAPGADGNCNCNICPYMALNTMEKLYVALRDLAAADRDRGRAAPRREEEPRPDARDGAATVGKGDLGAPVVTGD